VPRQVEETQFWENYFYRVTLILGEEYVADGDGVEEGDPEIVDNKEVENDKVEKGEEELEQKDAASPSEVMFDWESELAKEVEGHE
jgi:hypothetical protein